jgi:hypothetical protein
MSIGFSSSVKRDGLPARTNLTDAMAVGKEPANPAGSSFKLQVPSFKRLLARGL